MCIQMYYHLSKNFQIVLHFGHQPKHMPCLQEEYNLTALNNDDGDVSDKQTFRQPNSQ